MDAAVADCHVPVPSETARCSRLLEPRHPFRWLSGFYYQGARAGSRGGVSADRRGSRQGCPSHRWLSRVARHRQRPPIPGRRLLTTRPSGCRWAVALSRRIPCRASTVLGNSPGEQHSDARVQSVGDTRRRGHRVPFNLEVPEAQGFPPGGTQLRIDATITCLVAGDLLVPVRTRSARPVLSRVTVPETSVYENGQASTTKCNVRTARDVAPVAAPTSET